MPSVLLTTSGRDIFNAAGPGIVHGIKWVFGLMARPWSDIPFTGPGEPFESLKNAGTGLSRRQRRMLLAVIQTSEIL